MSEPPGVERLSDNRYLVLLLRLLVDGHGRVVHGDVGAFEEEEDKERWIHFHGPDGLLEAVQAWLAADHTTC
jgi:hypothetical protein